MGLTQACTDVPHATAHVWASDITHGHHNTHMGLTQVHTDNTDVIAPTASHSTHMGLRPAQTSHGRHTHVNSTQTSHVDVTAHTGHTGTCRCHGTHGYHTAHMGITRISQHTRYHVDTHRCQSWAHGHTDTGIRVGTHINHGLARAHPLRPLGLAAWILLGLGFGQPRASSAVTSSRPCARGVVCPSATPCSSFAHSLCSRLSWAQHRPGSSMQQ